MKLHCTRQKNAKAKDKAAQDLHSGWFRNFEFWMIGYFIVLDGCMLLVDPRTWHAENPNRTNYLLHGTTCWLLAFGWTIASLPHSHWTEANGVKPKFSSSWSSSLFVKICPCRENPFLLQIQLCARNTIEETRLAAQDEVSYAFPARSCKKAEEYALFNRSSSTKKIPINRSASMPFMKRTLRVRNFAPSGVTHGILSVVTDAKFRFWLRSTTRKNWSGREMPFKWSNSSWRRVIVFKTGKVSSTTCFGFSKRALS